MPSLLSPISRAANSSRADCLPTRSPSNPTLPIPIPGRAQGRWLWRFRRPALGREGDCNAARNLAAAGRRCSLAHHRRWPLAPLVAQAVAVNANLTWQRAVPLDQVYGRRRRGVPGAAVAVLRELSARCHRSVRQGHAGHRLASGRDGGNRRDGHTGLHFSAGDAGDLTAKVRHLLSDAPALAAMRIKARAEFAEKYTATANHARLMAIYADALARWPRRAHEPRSLGASSCP